MIIFIESNTSGTGEYFYKLCIKKKLILNFWLNQLLGIHGYKKNITT